MPPKALKDQYPREYARYRLALDQYPSFRAYLRSRGILDPLSSRPSGMLAEGGQIMSHYTKKHLELWPEGTVREIDLPETKKYKKERRYIYTPTHHHNPHHQPPPPPPPPPAAASA